MKFFSFITQITDTAQKMKFYIEDLVTFTEEILNGKLHFLCSMRFCCFQECRLQRSQFENDSFSKKNFAVEVLGIRLPHEKWYFQEHQSNAFLPYGSNN